jgi:hypothetical protein
MEPGGYQITITSAGMQSWQGTLQLATGQQAVIDATLTVSTAATQITVAENITPVVETVSPTLALLSHF